MFLVRYALGMLGIALCVIGATRMQAECRMACGTLAGVEWDAGDILPGIAGLIGGAFALAVPHAGAVQPPPAAPLPTATGPPF
ncbi:hypothetical protein SAMN04488021_11275 [Paracoccus aminovorans]|uniref:Uncharacterized protein n=1 Tax=Paracoccus aminovorans TaxID=34004 RepID=A0A1I3A3V3_9RHOB|nr:hypothetical protein [Paracoccus aminovorans]CQR84991.1 putative membrane protein [Paracoccus aminovorans]SFH44832.1 hypothetical protein SAMN04488021_11275 [Paracoccus aminovorans]